jgi:nitrogen fixation protein NifU and related proteins
MFPGMQYAIERVHIQFDLCRVNKMSVKEFDFWQDNSLHFLEMAFRHDRREKLQKPDGYGKKIGECGDTVEMFLCINKDRIQSVTFDTDGCINTNACANTVSHLTEGKTIEEAWEILPEDVIEFLETLPEENYHCAELAVGALYLALANCQERHRNLWKNLMKSSCNRYHIP